MSSPRLAGAVSPQALRVSTDGCHQSESSWEWRVESWELSVSAAGVSSGWGVLADAAGWSRSGVSAAFASSCGLSPVVANSTWVGGRQFWSLQAPYSRKPFTLYFGWVILRFWVKVAAPSK